MERKRDIRLTPRARDLRTNATWHENHLWHHYLKTHSTRFFRQFIIGEYITDFCCRKAKLVIELDGNHHFSETQLEYDRIRDYYLQECGFAVMRFSNREIEFEFPKVCAAINRAVRDRTPPAR